MKAKFIGLALTAGLLIAIQAEAQSPTPDSPPAAPETRAQVKSDARAAEKSGAIPRGQADPNLERDTTKSTANRADVKSATKVAEKSGQLQDGEASKNFDSQNSKSTSGLTRAQRKAAAKAAEKNHEIPRGESNVNN